MLISPEEEMSANQLALTGGHRWARTAFNHPNSDRNDPSRSVPRPLFFRQSGTDGAVHDPWRLFEERVRTGPYELTIFPSQPLSPIRILVLNDYTTRSVSPQLRQFIRRSPPRIRGEWQRQWISQEDQNPTPSLPEEDFKKVMKTLKKQTYQPKQKPRRRSLFDRSNSTQNHGNTEGNDEDGKDCAICLESFVAKQEVLVTPCNHMFHESCLMPWVKSHDKCPVCRFDLCERRESGNNVGGNNHVGGAGELSPLDVVALIRAMEDAFRWVNMTR